MKRFLIFDGNSILNRAFYGLAPLTTKEGLPTNAVFGFLKILKKHIDQINPDSVACAFDMHAPTFRHKMFQEYKGKRKGMPEDLAVQVPYAKKAVKALGITLLECEGFEADDLIGSSVRTADMSGDYKSYIVTGDRDSLQLITDTTSVILTKKNSDVIYTPEVFREEFGIEVSQFIDLKALMGDSSDNIPGVPGIGEKTAVKLISDTGSLDNLYNEIDQLPVSASVRDKLRNGREMAYLSKELATIVTDVPLCSKDILLKPCVRNDSEFLDLCNELEFKGMPMMFGIKSSDRSADRINYGFRTVDITSGELKTIRTRNEIVLGYRDDRSVYFAYDDTIRICSSPDSKDLVEFLSNNSFACHDLKDLLLGFGIQDENVRCTFDTMLAAYLLNPGKSRYPFEEISYEYLGRVPENTEGYIISLSELINKMRAALSENEMLSLLTNVEIPLSSVLARMEYRGFRIDKSGIHMYMQSLADLRQTMLDTIYFKAGHEFNVNSTKQLGEVLFDELGLPTGKKNKNGYSTDAETLESLADYHSIIPDILYYRKLSKLISTYGESLINTADAEGRIHTKFSQTGTATGRLSSSEPNLQNIPARDDIGKELRKYFIADEGHVLIDADYSQIELRILAALANDENMLKSFREGNDIHSAVASQVFGVPIEDVTDVMRRRAKAVNFGIVYGIGDFSLAKDLGITRKRAREYIESYLDKFSGVRDYLKNSVEFAKEQGYTKTILNRRRYIPELKVTNRNLVAFGERVAMNSPIQGSAADIIKVAMINVERALNESSLDARLIMQVHDELVVESSADCAEEAAQILKREMESAISMNVLLRADVGTGTNWYDSK